MFYLPPEIQKSPIEVQPAVHKGPAWFLLFSSSVVSDSLWPYELQYASLPCPSPSTEAFSNSFHWVADAIQPSHLLSHLLLLPSIFPSIRAFFFFFLNQWVDSSHQETEVLELQHQFFHWIFRADFPYNWLVGSPCSARDFQESSPFSSTTVRKDQFFSN